MKATYNKVGQERKDMVAALGDITGCLPKYKGVFSQAYQVGEMEIDRDGTIEFGATPVDEAKRILGELEARGYKALCIPEELRDAPADPEVIEATMPAEPTKEESTFEESDLSVSMPKDFFTEETMTNLKRIIDGKGKLMKSAFGATELQVLEDEEQVSFPWFRVTAPTDAVAYTHFIAAICNMAKTQTRITAKEKETDNEKYAFRCFLLRLGFIGPEYKEERKVLLKNLSGSSAFKNGKKEEQAS